MSGEDTVGAVREFEISPTAVTQQVQTPSLSNATLASCGGRVAFIYTLADPRTHEVRYVGKAFDLKKRFSIHVCDKTPTHRGRWIRHLRSVGLRPEMEVLETVIDYDDTAWPEAEKFWISNLRFLGCRLTNADSGGLSGKRQSLETKQKIGAANRGRVHSEEIRRHMSESHVGFVVPKERREKISLAMAGKKKSEATRARMRLAQKGKFVSHATRLKMSASAKLRSPEIRALHGKKVSEFWKTHKFSDDALRRIRVSATGRLHTQEAKMKISRKKMGQTHTPETRTKISLAVRRHNQNLRLNTSRETQTKQAIEENNRLPQNERKQYAESINNS